MLPIVSKPRLVRASPLIRKWIRWISTLLPVKSANLRLRTKLLLSLVAFTAGLTCATLLVVRHTAQAQVQRQIEEGARNAILTIQAEQRQRETALSRKADLLATLAFIRNGDPTTIRDASQDPWQSGDCDLFVLANPKGKIVALHTTSPRLSAAAAEELLRGSLKADSGAAWWFSSGLLYQVVLQPYYEDEPMRTRRLGTVVVGRELDARRAGDLARISSSHLAFRYRGGIVMSTLSPAQEQELVLQAREDPERKDIQIGQEKFLASSVALTSGTDPALNLIILKSYDEAAASLRRLNRLLLGLGLAAVLLGGALLFVLSDRFTRPLAGLAEGVRALEQGDFAYPLKSHGGDEVAQVTRTFEHMRGTLQKNEQQRQRLEDELRQTQKMEAMGRLAGGVAHDFNNLLTVIKGHSDLLAERLNPADPISGSCQQIRKATDRAASLTRQLLAFSRKQVLQPRVLDLNELIAEMSKLLRRLIREDIEFNVRLGESLGRVKADPGQIEQVLMNLTVNACDAMPQGGRLTVETRNVAADEDYARTHSPVEAGRYVLLAVTDTGHGMDAATKSRIFEPFFTTKEKGKGTGLGLATVYGVVQQSEGFIWVDAAPGKGARFEIFLPQVREEAPSTVSENVTAVSGNGRETVLVVEDEEDVRALTTEFLSSAGYRVLTAQNGVEALEIAERLGKTIRLLITDVVMPRMNGTELARQLKSLFPDLKIIYTSGYVEEGQGNGDFVEKASFLQKPFSRDILMREVAEALRGKPSRPQLSPTHTRSYRVSLRDSRR